MARLIKLLHNSAVRYLIIGGVVYVLEIALILALQGQNVDSVMAVAIAFIVGTLVSFLLQKLVTFGDRRLHHKVVGGQLVAVLLLVAFNFGFTVLATKLLIDVLPATVVRTGCLVLCTIWNYYLYKTRIFTGKLELVS